MNGPSYGARSLAAGWSYRTTTQTKGSGLASSCTSGSRFSCSHPRDATTEPLPDPLTADDVAAILVRLGQREVELSTDGNWPRRLRVVLVLETVGARATQFLVPGSSIGLGGSSTSALGPRLSSLSAQYPSHSPQDFPRNHYRRHPHLTRLSRIPRCVSGATPCVDAPLVAPTTTASTTQGSYTTTRARHEEMRGGTLSRIKNGDPGRRGWLPAGASYAGQAVSLPQSSWASGRRPWWSALAERMRWRVFPPSSFARFASSGPSFRACGCRCLSRRATRALRECSLAQSGTQGRAETNIAGRARSRIMSRSLSHGSRTTLLASRALLPRRPRSHLSSSRITSTEANPNSPYPPTMPIRNVQQRQLPTRASPGLDTPSATPFPHLELCALPNREVTCRADSLANIDDAAWGKRLVVPALAAEDTAGTCAEGAVLRYMVRDGRGLAQFGAEGL
ncbi:hypothetical protein HMN09_00775400 [Mycena chlorophos]|uniref:Uncharacterized protein n=1 Tax=Mycena chlorophos TaxID=658473 RepID=A0A8H6SV49_MYCCL|nr:hypothetical protein HMN09_00775400 [Mycena chlorophos]